MLEKLDMARSETEKQFHEPFPLVYLLFLVGFLQLPSTECWKLLREAERSVSSKALVWVHWFPLNVWIFSGLSSALHYLIINTMF